MDLTVLPTINSIASEQASATENTEKKCTQLLDYLATHDNSRIRYHTSDMVLNIHSDASYLSETNSRSCVAGHFSLEASQIHQANCTQWRTLYHVRNLQVCRGIGSRSRIGSIISQLQRRQNYATNFTGNGAPKTVYAHKL